MSLSHAIIDWSVTAGQAMLSLAMIMAMTRLIRGPRAQDRILAADTLYNMALLQILIYSIKIGSAIYLPVILILAILGFVSTIALSKFIMRGEVIE